jgi:hypothetical protein
MVDLIPLKILVWPTFSYCGYPIFGRGMPSTEFGNVHKSYRGILLCLYFRDNVHVLTFRLRKVQSRTPALLVFGSLGWMTHFFRNCDHDIILL